MITQTRSTRKPTGGRYHKPHGKKKLHENGREPYLIKLDPEKNKMLKARGSVYKKTLLSTNYANVADPKTKTIKKVLIKTVSENPANRHYVRRNIMTKGAIVMTELGKARITSRPGQNGVVNAVLIE